MKLRNKEAKRKVVHAIHANEGVTSWYANVLQDMLQQAYADAVHMLTAVLPEPIDVGIIAQDSRDIGYPFTDTMEVFEHINRTTGTEPKFRLDEFDTIVFDGWTMAYDAPPKVTKVDRALKKWGDKWQRKFDKLSRDVSKKFARRSFSSTDASLKAALRNAGFTVSFKPTKRMKESYQLVVADNVGLIRNLQQSLYNKIQQDTWASVRAGGDMAKLSEKLHKSYGIEANRAALIARDQNNKAKATLESARRQELGLKQAIWQHSGGGKEPRIVHLKWGRDGQVFDLDKGLFDPDEGQWVLPGTLINCRCTSRAIIPGFDDED